MKKSYIKFILPAIMLAGMIQACEKSVDEPTPTPTPTPQPQPNPEVVATNAPKDIKECDEAEISLLRTLAKANGFEADMESNNPASWKSDHMSIVWSKDDKGAYHIVGLGGNKDGVAVIKDLKLADKDKTFKSLERIELKSDVLASVDLQFLPKLRTVILSGKHAKETVAPLKHVTLQELPMLDSLSLTDFPSLKTSNDRDREFKINYYYQYPKLSFVRITGTAITDMYIEPMEKLTGLDISSNPHLTLLYVADAKMEKLEYSEKEYPDLIDLTLKNMDPTSAKSFSVENMKKLKTLLVQNSPSINKAKVKNCPALTQLTFMNCSLTSTDFSGLDEVKIIDLGRNNLSQVDFSAFKKSKKVRLGHNDLKNTFNMKLFEGITELNLEGNELMTVASLAKYVNVELLNINGYKKSYSQKMPQYGNTPNPLRSIHINNMGKLERVLCNNNTLSSVFFFQGQKYPKLESIECKNNVLDLMGLVAIKATCGHLNYNDNEGGGGNCLYKDQRPYTVTNSTMFHNYSWEQEYVKDLAVSLKDPSMKDLDSKYFKYDKKNANLEILIPGEYIIKIEPMKEFPQLPKGLVSVKNKFSPRS
ncbi:hypothetical protein [Porphyromonas pogonae]|uniref:hypothetical protein n=1 Tax=Porphyromonas pogonae TaxID=867595 RepID=UPI002E787154|nr:hypothetical protein [Porphyromonas pogonae]